MTVSLRWIAELEQWEMPSPQVFRASLPSEQLGQPNQMRVFANADAVWLVDAANPKRTLELDRVAVATEGTEVHLYSLDTEERLLISEVNGVSPSGPLVEFLRAVSATELGSWEVNWSAARQLPWIPRVELDGFIVSRARLCLERGDATTPEELRARLDETLKSAGGSWRNIRTTSGATCALANAAAVLALLGAEESRGGLVLEEAFDGESSVEPSPPVRLSEPMSDRGYSRRKLSSILLRRGIREAAPGSTSATLQFDVPESRVAEGVARVAERVAGLGLMKWYFVRTGIPRHRLVVRVLGLSVDDWSNLLAWLAWESADGDSPLRTSSLVTHAFEFERYGGIQETHLFEQLAAIDTTAAVQLIPIIGRLEEDARCGVLALSMLHLAREFWATREAARTMIGAWRNELGTHLGVSRHDAPAGWRATFPEQLVGPTEARVVSSILHQRGASLRAEIVRATPVDANDEIGKSLLHQLANRLLFRDPLFHELRTLDYVSKWI